MTQSRGREQAPVFERVPPQNIEAERAVLGAMLLNPEAVGTAIEVFRSVGSEVFYVEAHRRIYDAMLALFHRSVPADVVTVFEELQTAGHLEEVGGPAYLSELMGAVPTSANVGHYAQIVLDASVRRRLIVAGTQIVSTAYDGEGNVAGMLDRAESGILRIADDRVTSPIRTLGALVPDGVTAIESMVLERGIQGLRTGYAELDSLLCGMKPSDMIVLAARPSVGKTAFALNIARHLAVQDQRGVLVFSLEMAQEQITQRLLCMEGRIDSMKLRLGFLAKNELPKLAPAAARLSSAPIYIDETANITMLELRSKARRHMARHEVKLIIIDYMQLMSSGLSRRPETRQVEMSEISRGIKGLARELRVPVLALSQLSREAERDEHGTPKLSHLRESGSIEQDADVVMMLWRPPKSQLVQGDDTIKVIVAKHRNGPTGTVELMFRKNFQRFESVNFSAGGGRQAESASAPIGAQDELQEERGDDDVPF